MRGCPQRLGRGFGVFVREMPVADGTPYGLAQVVKTGWTVFEFVMLAFPLKEGFVLDKRQQVVVGVTEPELDVGAQPTAQRREAVGFAQGDVPQFGVEFGEGLGQQGVEQFGLVLEVEIDGGGGVFDFSAILRSEVCW